RRLHMRFVSIFVWISSALIAGSGCQLDPNDRGGGNGIEVLLGQDELSSGGPGGPSGMSQPFFLDPPSPMEEDGYPVFVEGREPAASEPLENLSGVGFRGLDLSDKDLSHVDLSYADFTGANLKGADFSGSDLSGADLSESKGFAMV